MSTIAHPDHYASQRAAIAAQGHEHMSFVIDNVIAFAQRKLAVLGRLIEKWSEAHHQAVQDRIFWELTLSDRDVMEELRAVRARARVGAGGE